MNPDNEPNTAQMEQLAQALMSSARRTEDAFDELHAAVDNMMASFKNIAAYVGADALQAKAQVELLEQKLAALEAIS